MLTFESNFAAKDLAIVDSAQGMNERPAGLDAGKSASDLRQIGRRLTIIARMLRSNFDRQVVKLSVTRSQWSMIAVVSQKPGASQRSISEMLEMSEASAGRLIDRLCADGLLERREHSNDRRARAVYLTPAAEPLLKQLGLIAQASDQRMFKGFSEDEIDTLGGLLNRIYDNISRG